MTEIKREENFAKVIDFPKEVRVYGNISHVYFEGKDKFTTLIVEPNKASSSGATVKKEKRSKGPILIVPIKQKNSEVHFVKVPLQKLSKVPKAEKLGDNSYLKVNMRGSPERERLVEYKTNLREICKKETFNRMRNDFDTCFVFKQDDPLQKDLFTGTNNLPIADLFQFQEKAKLERNMEEIFKNQEPIVQQVVRKSPAKEAQTNTEEYERFLKFLVSPSKQKKLPK